MNGQKVVDFALDARFHKNSRFSGYRLIAFAEKHPGIYGSSNKSILNLNPIIIKGAEQAQQDIKTIVESRDCCPDSRIIRLGLKSKKPIQPPLHEKQNKLLRQLSAEQDGLCPYCASPLIPEQTHLDTVLPTGFDHSLICLATKLKYYEANALAGNLKAVCGTCNKWKGWAENRGAQLMRLIASGKYPAQPVKSTEHYADRKPRIYYMPAELPYKHLGAYTLAFWETLKQAIECFALRITYVCPHQTEWLFARWIEDARTLIFGCSECVPFAGAILAVDVKSKNWMRTKKHHDLPCRKTAIQEDWILFRELEKHMHLRPAHEIAFASQKKMHERFGFPPPPPLEVLAEQYKASTAEDSVEILIPLDMCRFDGIAEVARRIERDQAREHAALKERLGVRMHDSWAKN
jgi:hypothetical protein